MRVPTPDLAFTKCANAAAAAFFAAPAYVVYREQARVEVPSLKQSRDVNRTISVRTAKGDIAELAVSQDLPQGRRQTLAHAFPLSPTFDAISYFRIYGAVTFHWALDAYVEDVKPLTFSESVARPDVNVVVQSLKYYYPKFAPDSESAEQPNTHILLAPLPALTNGNPSQLYLHEVYCEPDSSLPTRVVYTGSDDRYLGVDFTTIDGHQVVRAVKFEQTFFGPLRLGRVHAIVNVAYDMYQFPTSAPEPELARP